MIGPMDRRRAAIVLLTAGNVLVFGLFGAEKLYKPKNWIDWMPEWLNGFANIPVAQWLTVIGIIEILMALFLLLPFRRLRQAGALLITLHLIAIVFEIGWNEIAIRDIGLIGGSLALLLLL